MEDVNAEDILKSAQRLSGHPPIPKKPYEAGDEYDFPLDFAVLTHEELGSWLSRIAAWKGYIDFIIANREMEAVVLDEYISLIVGKKIHDYESKNEKRQLKEGLIAKALESDKELYNKKIRLISLTAAIKSLKIKSESYASQFNSISREIARRSAEHEMFGKMLNR